MSYVKTNWAANDVVTSAKLNKIEQGISDIESSSGGGMVVYSQNNVLQTQLGDIAEAYLSGKTVWIITRNASTGIMYDAFLVISILYLDEIDDPSVAKLIYASSYVFEAYTPNDYPSLSGGG